MSKTRDQDPMTKPTPILPDARVWMQQVAEKMIREGITMKAAVGLLEIKLTPQECDLVFVRKEFQDILQSETDKHREELANRPGRGKSTAVGLMLIAIEKLAAQEQWEKVVNALEKLSKLEGWQGADSNINVFAGLNARDIAEAKARLKEQIDATESRPAKTFSA